jgi:hypothetical protein
MTISEDKGLVSVTIILPVMDEVISQEKTLSILERDFGIDQQMIIVVCDKTTNESLEVARQYSNGREGVELLWQSRPYLGGAIQDAIARVKTTHYLIMASDLETHPSDAIRLWEMAQRNPTHIIVGSRWLNPKSFTDYGKSRLLANRLFQIIMSGMWHQYITDYTFGFRVIPMRYGGKISPTALKHEYLLESFLLMLKLGAEVIEIPTKWSARIEGVSHNVFNRNTKYLMTAVKVKLKKSNEQVDWS